MGYLWPPVEVAWGCQMSELSRASENIDSAGSVAGFRNMAAPPRLWVPCAGEVKPRGTRVRRGESLVADAAGPASPVDGTIAGTSVERLLGGQEVKTVVVESE